MIYVTPSELIEYLYCPRFIYFMNCLNISQHEDKRYLVKKGREIHEKKKSINKNYLRKKIGCNDKEIDVYISSEKLHLVGLIDEVLLMEDGFACPLDYKFSEYKNRVYKTYKYQQVCYALLIEENFGLKVNKAYICYVRSKNYLKEISITKKAKEEAKKYINEIFDILNKNYFPKRTKYKNRCLDCTYKNICIK